MKEAERVAEKWVKQSVEVAMDVEGRMGLTTIGRLPQINQEWERLRESAKVKIIKSAIREFAEAVAENIRPDDNLEDDCLVIAHKQGMVAAINLLLREAGSGKGENGKA